MLNLPPKRKSPPLPYLLFTLVAGAGACLLAQAPRVRVAAARATTAAILVMVMEYFASFLCWLRCVDTRRGGFADKEKSLIFFRGCRGQGPVSARDQDGCPHRDPIKKVDHIVVAEPDAPVAGGCADQLLLIGSVQIDVA